MPLRSPPLPFRVVRSLCNAWQRGLFRVDSHKDLRTAQLTGTMSKFYHPSHTPVIPYTIKKYKPTIRTIHRKPI
jgi:hypothetical protein